MKKPFVIAISGVSGSGKTAVTNELKERLENCAVLSFDDYDDVCLIGRDINDLPTDRNGYDDWQVEPIVADIKRLLKEPLDYIIMDYPFGRQNSTIAPFIDLSVFVDVPLDVALARRIIRDYTDRGCERHMLDELKAEFEFKVITILLTCSENENVRRMQNDGRKDERIAYSIENTRTIFDGLDCPKIDTTGLTPEQTAERMIKMIRGI